MNWFHYLLPALLPYEFQIRPNQVNPTRTICEVLCELHRDATDREDVASVMRIEEAYDMAKRMQRALDAQKGE